MNALEFSAEGGRWHVDLGGAIDLSIPLVFDGEQPRFFAEQPAAAVPLEVGDFVGSVARGASCNCAVYTFAPHCHGTHTECVGHVTGDEATLATRTPVAPCLALLISVEPRALGAGPAPGQSSPSDRMLDRDTLERAAAPWAADAWSALVVRTLPNPPGKRHRAYTGSAPAPYFTPAAMRWIVERGVTSLVVDLPSLDRADDGGVLAAHRVYWGLPTGATRSELAARGSALVTELAYVPETAADGLYLLDLQVPPFATDAAPSRPVIYPLRPASAGLTHS